MSPLIVRACWQAIALLMAAHFAGWSPALPAALVLGVAQAVHVSAVRRRWRALDVQVRWFFLALLLLGTLAPWRFVHVVQFAGLLALLVADYCLAARLLTLLPWNRRGVPLTPEVVRWILLSPPGPGSIAERLRRPVSAAPRGV
jgi:hypothetical protein